MWYRFTCEGVIIVEETCFHNQLGHISLEGGWERFFNRVVVCEQCSTKDISIINPDGWNNSLSIDITCNEEEFKELLRKYGFLCHKCKTPCYTASQVDPENAQKIIAIYH